MLCFNTFHEAFNGTNEEDIKEVRAHAPPLLTTKMNKHNASEQLFYAQLAFETLMEVWERTPLSKEVYILTQHVASDNGSEKLSRLIRQLAYGLKEGGVEPHIYGGRALRTRTVPPAADGPEVLVNTIKVYRTLCPEWQPKQCIVNACAEKQFPWEQPILEKAQDEDALASALIRTHSGGRPHSGGHGHY